MSVQHIFKVAGPPVGAPTGEGHHYVDTLNGNTYISKGTGSVSDWVLVSGTTGSADNLTYYNSSGVLADLPGYTRDTITGGLVFNITEQPNNLGGFSLHTWNTLFDPLQNSPNENWNIFNVPVYFDVNSGGFSQGTAGNAVQLWNASFIHQGSGNVGGMVFHNEGFQIGNGVDPITVGQMVIFSGYGNIAANVTLDGAMLGYGMSINVNASASITGNFYINAFYDYNQIQNPTSAYTSVNLSPNITEVSNANGGAFTGVNVTPQIGTLPGSSSAQGINISPSVTTLGASAGVIGVNFNPNLGAIGASGYVHGVDIYGIISSLGGNFNGVAINPTINGGAGDFYGVNITPQGGATLNIVNAINVDLAGLNSGAQKKGLSINDGAIQAISNYDTSVLPASPGFASLNQLTGTFTVAGGSPMSNTLVFANQLSVNALFYDDMGPDAFGGFVGFTNLGLATQISVQNTKTVDTINSIVAAFSVPSIPGDGGTVTNATMYLAGGVFPGGGSLTVDNLFGFKILSGFSTLATKAWGLYVDDSSTENFISKSLVIGGATKEVTNSDVGFEIASTKALLLARMTTAQKNALTAVDGMLVYDTDLGKFQGYEAGAWVNLV